MTETAEGRWQQVAAIRFRLFFNQQPEQNHFIMKRLLILTAMISTAAVARADLVMQNRPISAVRSNLISITIKIHGDKVRQDVAGSRSRET